MTKHIYGVGVNGNPLRTQAQFVKDWLLKTGGKVSQKKVTEEWGFTRLSAIIFIIKDQLAEEGGTYVVRDEFVKGVNRYGNECRFKNYWIEKA